MKLEKKVALITGAAGGIGLATAQLFANEGAFVVLADIDGAALEQAKAGIASRRVSTFILDVTDPVQMEAAVDHAVACHGRLDVLVANAGIVGPILSIEDCPLSAFEQVMAVNVKGVWLGIKYAMPVMRRQGSGSIIVASSGAALKGMPNMGCYNTSKHAVTGIMRCAAKEGAPHGIRVNTVNPGPVETRMIESIETGLGAAGKEISEVRDKLTAAVPMGRYGRPEEVAQVMLFLASDDSSYCTGGLYMVDGGNSA